MRVTDKNTPAVTAGDMTFVIPRDIFCQLPVKFCCISVAQ